VEAGRSAGILNWKVRVERAPATLEERVRDRSERNRFVFILGEG
jgi:hypothetical protein